MLLSFFERERTLKFLLWFGIVFRILLYFFISPYGADAHGEVINFIATQHRLPHTREIFCAMHPPLYYLLAQPFYFFDSLPNLKITQLLSVALSCINLYILYLLAKQHLKNILIRNVSFLLAIFLYSYITFSLYVTNDSLAFLIGSMCYLQLSRFFETPSQKNEIKLGLLLGVGLLTKGTFLAFVPVVLFMIGLVLWLQKIHIKQIVTRLVVVSFITLTVGGYKFVENWYYEGHPVVHNMDIFPLNDQKVYVNYKSFYGFNLKRLMKAPSIYRGDDKLLNVYPMIMYATFWYKFADLENDFDLGVKTRFKYIGSLIYLVAIIPSVLIFIGFFVLIGSAFRFLTYFKSAVHFKENIERLNWLGLFVMSFALVIAAGYKYDAWSCFHGRLFSQAFFSILVMLYIGLFYLESRNRLLFKVGIFGTIALAFLYTIYFSVEILYKFVA